MLRREGRDSSEAEGVPRRLHRISDREDARIKHADDVAGPRLGHDVALLGHHLLRLTETRLPLPLDVPHLHVRVVVARDDAHKRDPVAVVLVHICLNLEDERGEIVLLRIDQALVGHSRKRGRAHDKEMLKERLDAEVCERGSEEDRGNFSVADLVLIEFHGGAVEQLDLALQVLHLFLRDILEKLRIIDVDIELRSLSGSLLCVAENEHLARFSVVDALEALA